MTGWEKLLINIVGKEIQSGSGKLVACGHVIEVVIGKKAQGYIFSRFFREMTVDYMNHQPENHSMHGAAETETRGQHDSWPVQRDLPEFPGGHLRDIDHPPADLI